MSSSRLPLVSGTTFQHFPGLCGLIVAAALDAAKAPS
jgi:hypothetical protein